MNSAVLLADLDMALARLGRGVERAETLRDAVPDCCAIANDLHDARHVLDRVVNEVRHG
jgi:hypothetical protein